MQCSNFACCGLTLPDMHALVAHFEDKHVGGVSVPAEPVKTAPRMPSPVPAPVTTAAPPTLSVELPTPIAQPQAQAYAFPYKGEANADLELDVDNFDVGSEAGGASPLSSAGPATPPPTSLAPYNQGQVQNQQGLAAYPYAGAYAYPYSYGAYSYASATTTPASVYTSPNGSAASTPAPQEVERDVLMGFDPLADDDAHSQSLPPTTAQGLMVPSEVDSPRDSTPPSPLVSARRGDAAQAGVGLPPALFSARASPVPSACVDTADLVAPSPTTSYSPSAFGTSQSGGTGGKVEREKRVPRTKAEINAARRERDRERRRLAAAARAKGVAALTTNASAPAAIAPAPAAPVPAVLVPQTATATMAPVPVHAQAQMPMFVPAAPMTPTSPLTPNSSSSSIASSSAASSPAAPSTAPSKKSTKKSSSNPSSPRSGGAGVSSNGTGRRSERDRAREKLYFCTVRGCTKAYLNPNGLKYHMAKGTCTFDGPVCVQAQRVQAAAAAGASAAANGGKDGKNGEGQEKISQPYYADGEDGNESADADADDAMEGVEDDAELDAEGEEVEMEMY